MTTIRHIAVHHTGGTARDAYASSAHLTPADVNAYHKQRWDFESSFIKGSYGGYNFIYDPKTRQINQFRAIGEETAAQYGHNFDTVSLCIIGNFSIKPGTALYVDRMTKQMEDDVAFFLLKLIGGTHDFIIAPGTIVDLSPARAHPHRYYQPSTACYGGIPDGWVRDLLAGRRIEPVTKTVQKRIESLTLLVSLYRQLLALLDRKRVLEATVRGYASDDRDVEGCEGYDVV